MIRNAILVIGAALATTAAAASTNPPPTSGQATTPSASLSDVNTFGGAGATHAPKHATKYAAAAGQQSNCQDAQGNTVPCAGGATTNSQSGGSDLSGLGLAMLGIAGLAVGLGSNGGAHGGHSISP
jgi:hypothetical protein